LATREFDLSELFLYRREGSESNHYGEEGTGSQVLPIKLWSLDAPKLEMI
jgi:hypothetical protein